jgi:hypothetical protein
MRPSNSGSATFMTTSTGLRPASLRSHRSREPVAAMAWITGMPSRSRAATDHSAATWGPLTGSSPMAKESVLISASQSGVPPASRRWAKAGGSSASVRSE